MLRRRTKSDVEESQFYQMPKFLFSGEFKELTNDARVLYSLLRDRHDLSTKNNWVNEKEEVYLFFTREEMAELLGCSVPKARKSMKELKKYGLVEEERQGLNMPNKIFLNTITARMEKYFHSGQKQFFAQDGNSFSRSDTEFNKTEKNKTNIYVPLPSDGHFLMLYKNAYEHNMGKEHPRIRQKSLGDVLAVGEYLDDELDADEQVELIKYHFNSLPKSNNGNILAFMKAVPRYLEELQMDLSDEIRELVGT